MDRNTVLFVVLAITIWYTWVAFFMPEPEVDPATQTPTTQTVAPETPAVPEPVPAVPTAAEVSRALEGCGANAQWSSHGGALSDLTIPEFSAPYDVQPLYKNVLNLGTWSPYGGEPGPARVLTDRAEAFGVGAGPLTGPAAALTPTSGMSGAGTSGGLEITHTIQPAGSDPCHFVATTTWSNKGSAAFDGDVWISAYDALPEGAGGMLSRYTSQSGASALIDGSVWTLYDYEELTGPTLVDEGQVGWFGIADRYFAAYFVPGEAHGSLYQARVQRDSGHLDGLIWAHTVKLDPGASHSETFQLYIGPKDLDVLNLVHPDLGNAVELGWFSIFARPLLFFLKLFQKGVGNWGVAIILLTVTVKTIFFPLTQSAFKSGQAMQAIQPQLQEIREKFADDQEQLNRRTMELFRENKVNPLGGCLPMFIQFPVWIALYNVLLSSVELYQTEFLYLRDLSSPDPYGILPVVVVGLIILQQQFVPTGNMDPMQARMMKFMPLMFGIFFFTFPSGLVVYIFVNTVLSVLQQWFIRRTYAPPAAPAPATT